MKLTDESTMPFGKYKGEKMANVPASYLIWIYDEWTAPSPRFGFQNKEVKAYIEENLDVIQQEVKNSKHV